MVAICTRRITLTIAGLLLALVQVSAQKKAASPRAKSQGLIDGVHITIDYHQPSARGRKIMGALVPYGKVWRTGANKTTSIKFSAPVKIEDKNVPRGKYGLYTIPGETTWTIIINKQIKWGAYSYDEKYDVARVNVNPMTTDTFAETFTITQTDNQVLLWWGNTKVAFAIRALD